MKYVSTKELASRMFLDSSGAEILLLHYAEVLGVDRISVNDADGEQTTVWRTRDAEKLINLRRSLGFRVADKAE